MTGRIQVGAGHKLQAGTPEGYVSEKAVEQAQQVPPLDEPETQVEDSAGTLQRKGHRPVEPTCSQTCPALHVAVDVPAER